MRDKSRESGTADKSRESGTGTPSRVIFANRADQIGFLSISALLVLLPLFFGGNRDWVVGAALAGLAIPLACMAYLPDPRARFKQWGFSTAPWVLCFPLAWIAWKVIYLLPLGSSFATAGGVIDSEFAAIDLHAARVELLRALLILTALGCVAVYANSNAKLKILLRALFFAAVVHAVFASLARMQGWQWLSPGFVFGFGMGSYVNENHFAGYLELNLAIGAGLLMAGLSRAENLSVSWRQLLRDITKLLLSVKAMVRLGMVLLVIALVISTSRGGNLAFFAALLLVATLSYFGMRKRPAAFGWLLVSILAVDLLVVGVWFGADRVADRLLRTRAELDATLSGSEMVDTSRAASVPENTSRASSGTENMSPAFESTQTGAPNSANPNVAAPANAQSAFELDRERPGLSFLALQIWRQSPVIGYGPGAFRALYPSVRSARMSAKYYDHVHNDWIQLLLEFGVIGALIVVVLVSFSLWCAWRALRLRRDPFASGLAFSALLGIVSLLIHGVFDFNAQIPANMLLLGLLCLLAVRARYRPTA